MVGPRLSPTLTDVMRALIWILVLLAGTLAAQRKPNIVLILSDDAGYADFGFQMDPAADMKGLTPHIDSIAKAGARFTSAYMSGCVCSPARAGLLTGRYQQRFGHQFNLPPGFAGGLDLKEKTIADRLRPLGYKTGVVGKWHLGYPLVYHPIHRGFDWFYGCLQGSRSYYPLARPSRDRVLQENGKPTPEKGYVTDRLGDAAVRFLEKHKAEPFFLFVSFTAPHGPLQPRKGDENHAALEAIKNPKRRKYAALVKAMDDNVGKILTALRKLELEKDTLVVFTNDNGGQTLTGANNAPLRGRKGQLWEGGIRVPMCMRWPSHIKPGINIEDPVISLDLLPTFVRAAGGTPAADWQLDGVDLLPRLHGKIVRMADRTLFWSRGKELAARHGDFKIYTPNRDENDQFAIFDVGTDTSERFNLARQEEPRALEIRERLDRWLSKHSAPAWRTATRKQPGRRRARRRNRGEEPRRRRK